MFDVLSLGKEHTLEKEIKITCVDAKKGNEPVLSILVSNSDLSVHEDAMTKHYRLILTSDNEGYQKRDHLSYCMELLYIVQDIKGLFFEGDKEVPFKEEYLQQALKASIVFRQWFANEVITAFAELRKLSEKKANTKN